MHDTIHLVKRKLPVAVVVTDKFVNEALAVGKSFGILEPPMVVLKHPFVTYTPTELEQLVEDSFPQFVQILSRES